MKRVTLKGLVPDEDVTASSAADANGFGVLLQLHDGSCAEDGASQGRGGRLGTPLA